MDKRLIRFMKKLRLWIFCRRLANLLLWCAIAGVAAAAVMELISYFVPWYGVYRWAAAAVAASVLVAFVIALVRYPRAKEAAAELDRTGLDERTVTAWEMLGSEGIFAEIQKKDTWEHISKEPVQKRLPIRMSWQRPVLLALLCIALIFCSLIPSPARMQAKSVHALEETAKEKVKKVEKAEEDIKKNEEFTSDELEELADTLTEIKKELSEVKTEDALAKAQERAQKKLSRMAEKADSEKKKNQLQQMADMIGGVDKSSESPQGDDKAKAENQKQTAMDMEEKLDELQEEIDENGNLDEMSQEELEEIAQQLEELSEAADDELSAAEISDLGQLAKNLAAGKVSPSDLSSAKAALSKIKDAAEQKESSKDSVSGDGKKKDSGDSSSDGNSQTGESSDSSADGNKNGDGNGNGNGNGSGNGNGNNGGSAPGGAAGAGWDKGSNKGKETDSAYNGEKVTVPDNEGDDENLTGRENEGTNYSAEGGDSPTWSGNQVQYDQVIGDYSRQAKSQIEKAGYPSGVKDIIKSYFEALQ